MALDITYDLFWLAIWILVSFDSSFFMYFSIAASVIFFVDLYQLYLFIFEYGDDDGFTEEEKQVEEYIEEKI